MTLAEGAHWGVLIMQSGAMTVKYTVTPGNRSLIALLGSFGGAYGLLYVPLTFIACAPEKRYQLCQVGVPSRLRLQLESAGPAR